MLAGLLSIPPTTATFNFLLDWYLVSGIIAGGFVIGLLLYFAVKYRAKKGAPPPSKGPENIWIPLAVVVIMAIALGAAGYQTFASASNIVVPKTPNSVTIIATGFQWGWNFTYPNGSYEVGNLTVPAGRVIILNVTSKDVYHALGIPTLAVKVDAIPGKVNQLWFQVNDPGLYKDAVRCFELCGVGHSFMVANLTVVSQSSWNAWMNGA